MLSESSPTARTHADDPLAAQAYRGIRQLIADGSLRPGARVTESALAQLLEMKRTPIREALRRLEAEDLLVSRPRRGVLVPDLRAAELEELLGCLQSLEASMSLAAAERVTDGGAVRLRDALQREEVALEGIGDEDNFEQSLHATIADIAGNVWMTKLWTQVVAQRERYAAATLLERGGRRQVHIEHRALVEAICAGNGAEAARLAHRHLENTKSRDVMTLEEWQSD